jgi:hypothetical protein
MADATFEAIELGGGAPGTHHRQLHDHLLRFPVETR